ncbi:hypothetical protein FOCC_FOCC015491, partial [Frankliniella occidentalis]
MSQDLQAFDLWKLGTGMDYVKEANSHIKGILDPMLYFGSRCSALTWHCEDADAYSISYLHFGESKAWYNLLACGSFMRHQKSLLSPEIIQGAGIPLLKVNQKAGDFVITFQRNFHSGYNHDFNIAEAVNFDSERWLDLAKLLK